MHKPQHRRAWTLCRGDAVIDTLARLAFHRQKDIAKLRHISGQCARLTSTASPSSSSSSRRGKLSASEAEQRDRELLGMRCREEWRVDAEDEHLAALIATPFVAAPGSDDDDDDDTGGGGGGGGGDSRCDGEVLRRLATSRWFDASVSSVDATAEFATARARTHAYLHTLVATQRRRRRCVMTALLAYVRRGRRALWRAYHVTCVHVARAAPPRAASSSEQLRTALAAALSSSSSSSSSLTGRLDASFDDEDDEENDDSNNNGRAISARVSPRLACTPFQDRDQWERDGDKSDKSDKSDDTQTPGTPTTSTTVAATPLTQTSSTATARTAASAASVNGDERDDVGAVEANRARSLLALLSRHVAATVIQRGFHRQRRRRQRRRRRLRARRDRFDYRVCSLQAVIAAVVACQRRRSFLAHRLRRRGAARTIEQWWKWRRRRRRTVATSSSMASLSLSTTVSPSSAAAVMRIQAAWRGALARRRCVWLYCFRELRRARTQRREWRRRRARRLRSATADGDAVAGAHLAAVERRNIRTQQCVELKRFAQKWRKWQRHMTRFWMTQRVLPAHIKQQDGGAAWFDMKTGKPLKTHPYAEHVRVISATQREDAVAQWRSVARRFAAHDDAVSDGVNAQRRRMHATAVVIHSIMK
jgi:hypothetical protein